MVGRWQGRLLATLHRPQRSAAAIEGNHIKIARDGGTGDEVECFADRNFGRV